MRRRRPLTLASVVGAAAIALVAAGCGSGRSSTTAATAPHTGPLAFARCMRAHGLSGWPDPDTNGGFDKSVLQQLGYTKVRVRSAANACGHLLPSGGSGPGETAQQRSTRLADGLSFARCMRSHGVTRFPDPNAQGELTVEMVEAQGIDVRAPAVLQVVQACLPASHGALTPGDVRRAINEAGG
jgi:hypothetical protein